MKFKVMKRYHKMTQISTILSIFIIENVFRSVKRKEIHITLTFLSTPFYAPHMKTEDQLAQIEVGLFPIKSKWLLPN